VCIKNSVGRNGQNDRADVKTVQILLNMNIGSIPGAARLNPDGKIGDATIALIEEYQRVLRGKSNPDGSVDPGGNTLNHMRSRIPAGLDQSKIHGVMIHASEDTAAKFSPGFISALPKYEINTPLRQAHFLAQVAHESGSLRYTEELAGGEAYEGRADLGNTQPGDGVKFKGRGLIQLTGRANYTAYGKAIGEDLTSGDNYKKLADDPAVAVDVSCWFWKTHKLSALADQDDVRAITKKINGGYNGLDDRMEYLERAKFFLLPA